MRALRTLVRTLIVASATMLAAGCSDTGSSPVSANEPQASGKDSQAGGDVPAVVLDAASTALPGGTITASEVDTDDGITVYDLEITGADGVVYEVEIAADGTVIEVEVDDDDDSDDGDSDDGDSDDGDGDDGDSDDGDSDADEVEVEEEGDQAEQSIALGDLPQVIVDAAAGALPGGTIVEAEIGSGNGVTVYDLEITGADGVLYEAEIAADGTVLEVEADDGDSDDGSDDADASDDDTDEDDDSDDDE